MTSISRLISMGTLSAYVLAPGWVRGAPPEENMKNTSKRQPEPEWMKGMPPRESKEYLVELRQRVAQGNLVRVRTIFHRFHEIGGSHFSLGMEGENTWATTICQIVAPKQYAGWLIPVNHASKPAHDSCWRTQGCIIEFDVNERIVEAENARVHGFTTLLYKEELGNVRTTMPGSIKKRDHAPQQPEPSVRSADGVKKSK
jgi:hypothetical protein